MLVCGLPIKNTPRIQGGSFTPVGSYPHVVRIVIRYPNGGTSMCTGTKLNSRIVLTVSHCVETNWESIVISSKNLSEPFRDQNTKVTKACIPSYKPKEKTPQLALLEVSDPMDPPYMKIANLRPPSNTIGWTIGFGNTEFPYTETRGPKILKVVQEPCYRSDMNDNFDCYVSTEGSSCQGDSGSPVIFTEGSESYMYSAVGGGFANCSDYSSGKLIIGLSLNKELPKVLMNVKCTRNGTLGFHELN